MIHGAQCLRKLEPGVGAGRAGRLPSCVWGGGSDTRGDVVAGVCQAGAAAVLGRAEVHGQKQEAAGAQLSRTPPVGEAPSVAAQPVPAGQGPCGSRAVDAALAALTVNPCALLFLFWWGPT